MIWRVSICGGKLLRSFALKMPVPVSGAEFFSARCVRLYTPTVRRGKILGEGEDEGDFFKLLTIHDSLYLQDRPSCHIAAPDEDENTFLVINSPPLEKGAGGI